MPATPSPAMPGPMIGSPIARGPFVDFQRRAGASLQVVDGWEVAIRYPREPEAGDNAVVDLSHRPTWEINGPDTAAALTALCGVDVPLRTIHTQAGRDAYRLTPTRAVVFGGGTSGNGFPGEHSLDVTGGWASLAVLGPDRERILNKITAVDLRERTLPAQGCCQGPIFGVNTLFGRFANRFELHVCTDSALFFQEVLLDAGSEFDLRPAGLEFFRGMV